MAPYCGPNLAALVPLLRAGLREGVTLGSGLPRAPLDFRDGAFELRRLSGGAGFGVQADLAEPFVDEGVVVRLTTWQEMTAWLCEHWDRADYGEPLHSGEKLRLTFTGDARALGVQLHRELACGLSDAMKQANEGIVAANIDVAAAACRAARNTGAHIDFDVIRERRTC